MPTVSALTLDLLALAAGAALVAAYAPFHLYWLAPPLLALLGWSWTGASARRAAWRGYLFGLGLFGGGVSWVHISLHSYGGAPLTFAVLANVLLVAYLALYPALWGGLLVRFWPRPGPVRWLLAWPALGLLLEVIRAWVLNGFPWLAPGYSQTESVLAGLAPIGGVLAVGWAVTVSAGLLLLTLRGPWRPLWPALLAALWLGTAVLDRHPWSEPAGEPLEIALIQGNIAQDHKWEPDALDRTLLRYLELSAGVARDSDVVIWPETAIPLFLDYLDPAYLEILRAQGIRTDTDYLIGIPSGNLDQGIYYNAVMALNPVENAAPVAEGPPPDPRRPRLYRKHHLLPFGEYLPLRSVFALFRHYVDIPMADFAVGGLHQPLLRAGGHPVGVSICFEAAFGDEIRRALPQAAYLVNVSNDAWFGNSLAPAQHLQIARMRAIETRRWLARATNTGITALVDPYGRIVQRGPLFEETVVQGRLIPLAGTTPYARFGDRPPQLAALALLLLGWSLRRRGT